MEIGKIELSPGSNKDCSAVQMKIDTDTMITVGFDKVGFFSEVYTGENYVVCSKKRSYSRCYRSGSFSELLKLVPTKYRAYLSDMAIGINDIKPIF